MKVLFIAKESLMHERMGIMSLISVLKLQGVKVQFVLADNVGIKGLKELIKNYEPSIIGYSIMTGEHIKLLELNRLLKKDFDFLSVFGGPHATFFPDVIYEDGVDAICIGEGDIAFPEFCKRVAEKGDFSKTPNFWVKNDREIIKNPLLPLVENLDSLPFPDRSLMYEADPSLYNEGHKMFMSMRGCPYACTYCFNDKYNRMYSGKGKVLRYRSAENVVDEIFAVRQRYPLDIVWMTDDIFLLKPKEWFERFSELYKKRIGLPLSVIIRANIVEEEIISLLKDSGLDSVSMGVECGNEMVANNILKRNLTNEQIINAARIVQKFGIKLLTQNLIGIPVPDAYKIDLETLDLNIKIKPTFAWSSILYPYPGTPIESYAKANGFLVDKIPFLDTNKRSTTFNFSKKDKKKIENIHKLFGLIVNFSFLRPLTNFLCSLRLKLLYLMLFYLWYGYSMKFKMFPFHSVRKELGSYIRLWWKFIQKS